MRVQQRLEFGDVEGHPFHGNQYTGDHGEKEQLLRRIAGMKATEGKQRWNDYWSLGYDASQSKDPEVAAIGKALMDAAMGKKTEESAVQQVLEFRLDD